VKHFASTVAAAFALANLYLLFLTGPLVSPQHQLVFHLPGSATALFLPVLLDVGLLTLLLFVALWLVRPHPRAEVLLWSVLLLAIPLVLVETTATFAGRPANQWLLWAAILGAVAALGLAVTRLRALLPWFARLRPAMVTVLAFVSLSALFLLAELLWFGWEARALNPPFVSGVRVRQPQATVPASSSAPRIVWIILDELSYRQVYGRRAPGLALPEFDRLAAESTVFTNTKAAAEYTRVAVPALLTGLALNATSPTANGEQLLLHEPGQRHWFALQPRDTVFGDAVQAGLPTGVAGWYEPYCRLLPSVLNHCFWTYSDNIPGNLSPSAPLLRNVVQPFQEVALAALHLLRLPPGAPSADALDVQRHAADFRSLLDEGDQLLASQKSGLLLLHMPIPHPWGFYDRRTGTFPGHRTSYLDNLALADAWLGHIRAEMQHDGTWDRTTVVVMGDHGWRTQTVWHDSGFWTPEDEAASQGSRNPDPPALILKLPAQRSGATLPVPFDAVRTRALLAALEQHEIVTPAQLAAWVSGPAPGSSPGSRQPGLWKPGTQVP
jgi:hypothetical protein